MSLVFGTREVSVGPTVGFQGDAPPAAYVSKGQLQGKLGASSTPSPSPCLIFQAGEGKRGMESAGGSRFCLDVGDSTASGEESSSIGCDSSAAEERERSDGEENDEEEVQSKFKGGLGSMGVLEESLPIKRGLSNFFRGKSKSFASFSNLASTSVEDLAKPENSFNKRRRTLLACKTAWSKRAFCIPLNTSLPVLSRPLDRTLEESGSEEEEEEEKFSPIPPPLPIQGRKFKSFRSPRSFSLTDLRDA